MNGISEVISKMMSKMISSLIRWRMIHDTEEQRTYQTGSNPICSLDGLTQGLDLCPILKQSAVIFAALIPMKLGKVTRVRHVDNMKQPRKWTRSGSSLCNIKSGSIPSNWQGVGSCHVGNKYVAIGHRLSQSEVSIVIRKQQSEELGAV